MIDPAWFSWVLILTLTYTTVTCSDQVFISTGTYTQWTIPDVSYPDPIFTNNVKPTTDIISSQGFPVEKHFIQTEDGYILALHRIPALGPVTRPPVLLVHGFLAASDQFLFRNDSTADLPFLLSRSGFDVWLGNVRGNVYSRHHATLSPEKLEFWNFSLDEYGSRDLPAMIELVRYKSGQDRLIYFGYSMGGALPYIMAATRPEYTKLISLNILLAPFVFGPSEKRSTVVKNFKPVIEYRVNSAYKSNSLNAAEVSPRTNSSLAMVSNVCSLYVTNSVCKTLLQDFIGFDESNNMRNKKKLTRLLLYSRGGTSINALYHIWNWFKSSQFLTYDSLPDSGRRRRGQSKKKMHIYRSNNRVFSNVDSNRSRMSSNEDHVGPFEDAREYDVRRMDIPTMIWYSRNDRLVDMKGIKKLAKLTPNLIKLNLISYKQFNHFDYWVHEHINNLLHKDLMEQLNAQV